MTENGPLYDMCGMCDMPPLGEIPYISHIPYTHRQIVQKQVEKFSENVR